MLWIDILVSTQSLNTNINSETIVKKKKCKGKKKHDSNNTTTVQVQTIPQQSLQGLNIPYMPLGQSQIQNGMMMPYYPQFAMIIPVAPQGIIPGYPR